MAVHESPDHDQTITSEAQLDRIAAWGRLLVAVILICLGGVLVRVTLLKTQTNERLANAAGVVQSNAVNLRRRGDLIDRRGRIIATSSIAQRLFVDPKMVDDIDTIAVDLARITGLDPVEIDRTILERPKSRYIVLADPLDDWRVAAVRDADLRGVGLEPRLTRHYPYGKTALSLLGMIGFEQTGLAGFEHRFESKLAPEHGSLTYWRDVRRQPLWVESGGYTRGSDGNDVRLSIDLVIQRIAEERLDQAIIEHNAGGGRIIVADPSTGEILAMCDRLNPREGWQEHTEDPLRAQHPGLGRNRCVTDPYEPGSTFKSFVWAVATELGLATPDEILPTPIGPAYRTSQGRRIRDSWYYEDASWRKVLVKSINSGMAMIAERMTHGQMQQLVRDFGFGQKTNCGLPGETIGIVTDDGDWSHYTQTSLAMGHEIAVTPVQLVRAFCTLARDGTIPALRITAASSDPDDYNIVRRVLSEQTVLLTREVMRDVMLEGTGRPAESTRYQLFGKSSTAQLPKREGGGYHEERYVSSFIAAAPLDEPKLVVLCIIDDPDKTVAPHGGGRSAGPVVRDVMDKALSYLGVPADHPDFDPDAMDQELAEFALAE